MPKQTGVFKVKGTMDDITFYKSVDGAGVRMKGGIEASRIANDPKFQRTRENGMEFGRAGKAGKTLRLNIRGLLKRTADPRMVSRLTREMMRVIKSDTDNGRGERNVLDGDLVLLQGFEFNVRTALNMTFTAAFTPAINRATGALTVAVPVFDPLTAVIPPKGATHFQLTAAGIAADFDAEISIVEQDTTDYASLQAATTAQTLTCTLPAASTLPLFLLFGIEFFQEVNGRQYPLSDSGHNALTIVAVSPA